jgi:hypothetical protein
VLEARGVDINIGLSSNAVATTVGSRRWPEPRLITEEVSGCSSVAVTNGRSFGPPEGENMNHMRKWGVAYLLAVLFGGSWVGQFAAQMAEGDGWVLFLSNTFENWQSEFLQLLVQALAVVAGAKVMFRKSVEDRERLEAKVDELRQNVLRKNEQV